MKERSTINQSNYRIYYKPVTVSESQFQLHFAKPSMIVSIIAVNGTTGVVTRDSPGKYPPYKYEKTAGFAEYLYNSSTMPELTEIDTNLFLQGLHYFNEKSAVSGIAGVLVLEKVI